MVFEIEGKPVGKGRPRIGKWGAYTPANTVNYENLVKFSFLQAKGEFIPVGILRVNITAIFEPPKSTSKKKYAELIGTPYNKKPDIDNIAKSILDGLNGVAYSDDNQVAELNVKKIYGDKSKAIVEIEVIGISN